MAVSVNCGSCLWMSFVMNESPTISGLIWGPGV